MEVVVPVVIGNDSADSDDSDLLRRRFCDATEWNDGDCGECGPCIPDENVGYAQADWEVGQGGCAIVPETDWM